MFLWARGRILGAGIKLGTRIKLNWRMDKNFLCVAVATGFYKGT